MRKRTLVAGIISLLPNTEFVLPGTGHIDLQLDFQGTSWYEISIVTNGSVYTIPLRANSKTAWHIILMWNSEANWSHGLDHPKLRFNSTNSILIGLYNIYEKRYAQYELLE